MKQLKLGSPVDAIGDAFHQNAQVSNRSYSLIEDVVDEMIKQDYDSFDQRLHEQMVFFYNQLVAKNCLSVNVCYGLENQSHHWVESVWISEADDDQRVFSISVTHAQISPSKLNAADNLKASSITDYLSDKLKDIRYCHPVFINDIREIYSVFVDLLKNNYEIQTDVTKTNWLTLTARANSGRNVVTLISRCFADASIETFNLIRSSKAQGYPVPEITYN
jgi:hypothetical protein